MDYETVMREHKAHITVYQAMVGWKAVHMWWNDKDIPGDGFWEPWQTAYCAFSERKHAVEDGRLWAASEGLPFVLDNTVIPAPHTIELDVDEDNGFVSAMTYNLDDTIVDVKGYTFNDIPWC